MHVDPFEVVITNTVPGSAVPVAGLPFVGVSRVGVVGACVSIAFGIVMLVVFPASSVDVIVRS